MFTVIEWFKFNYESPKKVLRKSTNGSLYQEKEKTREFYKILVERSNEAKENPEILIPLEDLHEL
ncbi:MAG: hypothetical protein AYK19_18670 [Theionarchaea archaeon DG-70-1]|nr:MAG: hypothetical protein AYK19_18670 [Theionarchaea archaeon DG-70-1]